MVSNEIKKYRRTRKKVIRRKILRNIFLKLNFFKILGKLLKTLLFYLGTIMLLLSIGFKSGQKVEIDLSRKYETQIVRQQAELNQKDEQLSH